MFPGHRLIELSVPLEHLAASEPLPAEDLQMIVPPLIRPAARAGTPT
jgi:hypothetical protein